MTLTTTAMQLFNSLSISSVLLMVALGLSITFGIMGVINFAHGEFVMVGAYVTYVVDRWLHDPLGGAWYPVALALAFLVTAGLGFLTERSLIRFLYGRPFESILATWGLSLILQQLARNVFGAANVEVRTPDWLQGGLALADGVQLPANRLFIIGAALTCVLGTYLFLNRTRAGCSMRAVMQNRPMAAALGINTAAVDARTFALGSGLAGIAGCVVSLLGSVGPATGQNWIIDSFMVVVLGGVGSIAGSVAGAVLIGAASPLFEFITTSSMGKVIIFALIVVFLQYRPAGLLALRTRALEGQR